MSQLLQLWLPILVTAVGVFMASSLIHMVFNWHASDYKQPPDEDNLAAAIRAAAGGGALPPGQYFFPYCSDMKSMQTEPMLKKFRDGPVAMLTVRANGVPKLGPTLAQWFVLTLVIATVAAALALVAYGLPGNARSAAYLVAIISFLAYGVGGIQGAIWMGKPWGSAVKDLLDAGIYAALSGLVFVWLWP